MYFTFFFKKEISLTVESPVNRVRQAIMANIENKKEFFGKETQKVFCGEEKDGVLSLDLNYQYFHKFSPFRRFECELSGDNDNNEKCTVNLTFKNDFFFFGIFMLLPFFAYGFQSKKWKTSAAAIVILFVIMTFTFNIKINKCMDEIEYILEKVSKNATI